MKSKKSEHVAAPFYALLISAGILAILGIIMVFSASSIYSLDTKGYSFSYAIKQFIFFIGSIFIGLILVKQSLATWKKLAKLGAIASVALTGVLLIPGVGKTVNGNTNWIDFKIFDVQPSEFAKFLLILWASLLLANKESVGKYRFSVIKLIVPAYVLVLLIILYEGDLGTASVIAGILAAILFVSGIELKLFGFLSGVGSAALLILIMTAPYRMRRLTSFINPFAEENYKTISWQPAHSLLGMASGGLFGVGLGGSRQKWGNLPEAHTDFIYAIIGEEIGLLGTVSVLILFSILVYSIFRIALNAQDAFTRNVCVGIGSWLAIQSVLNIGMAVSVLPVIGVSLPLVSYGGSALLATLVAISFVIGAALRDPDVKMAVITRFAR